MQRIGKGPGLGQNELLLKMFHRWKSMNSLAYSSKGFVLYRQRWTLKAFTFLIFFLILETSFGSVTAALRIEDQRAGRPINIK